MEIKRVALLGAGAVGAYFIWGLSEKPEVDFCVVAKGERKARLERDGVRINGRVYRPAVKTPEEASAPDLLLIATKHDALAGAMDDIRAVTGSETLIISLLNGVRSEEMIAEAVGEEHMLYATIRIASVRTADGITFPPERTAGIFFGERDHTEPTDRVKAVMRFFDGTDIRYTFVEDIMKELWMKYASNVSQNLPQAILGVGSGAYKDSGHMHFLAERLWEEAAQVAAARGVVISPRLLLFAGVEKYARYSTLQDLDAGRHTEIEMLAGDMVRMGQGAGVPVPFCEYTYHLIRAMEEKNDGRFDYPSPSNVSKNSG